MKRNVPSSGFTVLEMVVNLALLAGLLVSIAALVSRTSETVKDSAGKLTAAEKSEAIRRLVSADLSALPATADDALNCSASEDAWSLNLRVPLREGGWQEVGYRWAKKKGTLTRVVRSGEETTSRVVGTGLSKVTSRWLSSASEEREAAPESWSGDEIPALLSLELETSRLREEGKREKLDEAHADSSAFHFLIPVGGGPAQR